MTTSATNGSCSSPSLWAAAGDTQLASVTPPGGAPLSSPAIATSPASSASITASAVHIAAAPVVSSQSASSEESIFSWISRPFRRVANYLTNSNSEIANAQTSTPTRAIANVDRPSGWSDGLWDLVQRVNSVANRVISGGIGRVSYVLTSSENAASEIVSFVSQSFRNRASGDFSIFDATRAV